MANAGGLDNAKKVVEVDLKQKGQRCTMQPSSETRRDPFKDTSSVP